MKNGNGNGNGWHSWAVKDWPVKVFPGSVSRGRNLVRIHRAELLKCGALVRIGLLNVIIGEAYTEWLRTHTATVAVFVAANKRKK